jgi:phosphoglucosamine mutase
MPKLFGTDGIRAVAGTFPLDPAACRALGAALVRLLEDRGKAGPILIGRDTRESGDWIERALVAGVRGAAGQAALAGVIPTSAVSFLTRKRGLAAGVVISASHNPYIDNGIKIFSPAGLKIPDDWEADLEAGLASLDGAAAVPVDDEGPLALPDPAWAEDYVEFLKGRFAPRVPPAFKVVVDCANGASSAFAPRILAELGFDAVALHCSPDGRNINEGCGSLYPERLAAKVVETQAALGVAFDGDADRAVWVDESGLVLNGDHTLYVLARRLAERGKLAARQVVATTMSNMGLETALAAQGIRLLRTRVGDKYVFEEMVRSGSNLGGERSGHTILLDDGPTGDGILTALRMLEALVETGLPLSKLVAGFEEFPQILLNVPVRVKLPFEDIIEIQAALGKVRKTLAGSGRVDLRYSGTEPVARIMVEGRDKAEIEKLARDLAAVVAARLG